MSARSDSLNARLRIRAGRAFWTMPRSTSQTSPRLGTRLLLVEQGKSLGSNGRQVIVRQRAVITGSHGASDRLVHGVLLVTRQASEPLQHRLCLCAHALKTYPFGVKRASAGNTVKAESGKQKWGVMVS